MSKLRDKKVLLFWRDVQIIKGTKNKLPARIDNAMNEKDVANLWKNKLCSVLNEVDDSKCKKEFMSKVRLAKRGVVDIKEKARPTITNENFHETIYKAVEIITVDVGRLKLRGQR